MNLSIGQLIAATGWNGKEEGNVLGGEEEEEEVFIWVGLSSFPSIYLLRSAGEERESIGKSEFLKKKAPFLLTQN